MRIGIDGRALEAHPAGIGRYVWELSKCLDRILPNAEFFLYSRNPLPIEPISNRWTHRHESHQSLRKIKGILWQRFCSGRICKSDRLDAYWAAATFFPRLPSTVKKICTVHDLNHLLVPETMPRGTLMAYRAFFKGDVACADVVVANSQGTRERLKKLCGVTAGMVVTPSVSPAFERQGAEAISALRAKYGLGQEPYILGLSTLEPRKNLVNLINAFVKLKAENRLGNYRLVLVGGGGWKSEVLNSLLEDHSDQVVRCGYVEDTELPAFYSGARFFAFPSVYEGFGIPVLESVACGTPVLASKIPEILEAAQGNGLFVGTSVEEISSGLEAAHLQFASGVNRPIHLENVGWQREAEKLAAAFQCRSEVGARK